MDQIMGLRLSFFAVAALTVQSLSAAEPGVPLNGVEAFESSLSVRSTLQNSVHRCASDGESVWCWGSNEQGQLGNGGRAGIELATPIETLPRRIDDLAVGGQHTCAVAEERLFCWGDNRLSQLGVEGQMARRTPVEVLPGVGFLSVDAGTYHSCAVTSDHRLLCWGWNAYGQVGIDSSVDIVDEPTEVMLRPGVELALGGAHSCALSDGLVECWGRNDSGQLGDGGFESRAAPSAVVDLPSGIERLTSARAHSCAASNDTVWCWGSNFDAQTGRPYDAGDPATQSTPRPFQVTGLTGALGDLALDAARSCVAIGETMRCWGRVSPWPADPQPEPIELWRAANVIQDSDEPECARVDGSIVCINGSGRGEVSSAFRSARVDGLRPLSLEPDQRADLIVGPLNGCAQYDERELRCWGENGFGQLGQGSNDIIEGSVEMSFPGNPIVHDLDFGVFHACAVTSGGLFCWGNNFFGQLGLPGEDDRLEPTAVPIGVDSDTRLAAGFSFTCLWSPGTDTLDCFGDPPFAVDAGQTSVALDQPRTVSLGAGAVRDVVAGREHLCALIDDAGETLVRCLGRIRTEPGYDGRRSLRDVSTGLIEIESLSASGFSSCAQSGSEVVCWGLDHTWPAVSRGPNRAPFQVEFPDGDEFAGRAEGFSLGGRHACVAGSTGELVCIGLPRVQACTFREATGDLGSGSGLAACLEAEATELTDEELGWLPIEGAPLIAADAIASGEEFTCARIGRWIRCWGRGARGFAPPPGSESPVAPVLRPAVLEPSSKVPVDLDSTSSCPAFVISRVSLL
ncbi:MAG: hypothetical protein V2J10_07005, partial [Wenzhouxiangella sp.]|nr:hypothetical protein [Wenzhouxiangella sp.]